VGVVARLLLAVVDDGIQTSGQHQQAAAASEESTMIFCHLRGWRVLLLMTILSGRLI